MKKMFAQKVKQYNTANDLRLLAFQVQSSYKQNLISLDDYFILCSAINLKIKNVK